MYSNNIKQFGSDIFSETKKKWDEYKGKSLIIEHNGFAVFYSPFNRNPDLMIIGHNPGIGNNDGEFDWKREATIPDVHDYIRMEYRLAIKQNRLWTEMDRLEILQNSVKINLLFFRSQNIAEWNGIEKEIRKPLEDFCIDKVKEIIEHLKPKKILCEGVGTFDIFINRVLKPKTQPLEIRNRENKRLFISAIYNDDFDIIGIPHPTGAWGISPEDWKIIKEKLLGFFPNYSVTESI